MSHEKADLQRQIKALAKCPGKKPVLCTAKEREYRSLLEELLAQRARIIGVSPSEIIIYYLECGLNDTVADNAENIALDVAFELDAARFADSVIRGKILVRDN